MANLDDNLIDAEDLKLTYREISAKALRLVQSIGTGETEEARQANAAKARAYFKRSGALQKLCSTDGISATNGERQQPD